MDSQEWTKKKPSDNSTSFFIYVRRCRTLEASGPPATLPTLATASFEALVLTHSRSGFRFEREAACWDQMRYPNLWLSNLQFPWTKHRIGWMVYQSISLGRWRGWKKDIEREIGKRVRKLELRYRLAKCPKIRVRKVRDPGQYMDNPTHQALRNVWWRRNRVCRWNEDFWCNQVWRAEC